MRNYYAIGFGVLLTMAASVPGFGKELNFLQADPRFTGGEVNEKDPKRAPTFWFYNQYSEARAALQADGVALIAVTKLTYESLDKDSDALYMPAATDGAAKVYPLTDEEIAALKKYTADSKNTGGRTIIFDLGNASPEMANNLLKRLELKGHMAKERVSGKAEAAVKEHPVMKGPVAAVEAFMMKDSGYFDGMGAMRGLLMVGGKAVVPYVEKGELSKRSGGYIFLLQKDFLVNWKELPADGQHFFLNLVEYAAQDQFLHFVPGAAAKTGGAKAGMGTTTRP